LFHAKPKIKARRENTTILHDFPLQSLHLRGMGEIIVHSDPLSPLSCTSLNPNHSLIFFFFNSRAFEANRALEKKPCMLHRARVGIRTRPLEPRSLTSTKVFNINMNWVVFSSAEEI